MEERLVGARENLASIERELELKAERKPHADELRPVLQGAGSG